MANLVRIACLVRKAARRVDLEYASRPGEPTSVRRDTDDAEEVQVGGLRSSCDHEPGFAARRFTLAREARNPEARGKTDATHDDSAPTRTKRSPG